MLPRFSYADNPRPDDPVRAQVIGTGTDTVGTYFPTAELEAAQACVYSNEECTGQYAIRDIKVDKNTMVCAAQDSGKVDACGGDSGGPLLNTAGKQVTVVSWGVSRKNAIPQRVYSNVHAVFGWVKEFVCNNTYADDDAWNFISNCQQHRVDEKPETATKTTRTVRWICSGAQTRHNFRLRRRTHVLKVCPATYGACRDPCTDNPVAAFYATADIGYKDCEWLSSTESMHRSLCEKELEASRI